MPVMNDDVWRMIFTYLTDGEHTRRPLRSKGATTAMVGVCCAGGEAVAPCIVCREALYDAGGEDEAEERAALMRCWAPSRRPQKRVRRT